MLQEDEDDPELQFRDIAKYGIIQLAGSSTAHHSKKFIFIINNFFLKAIKVKLILTDFKNIYSNDA